MKFKIGDKVVTCNTDYGRLDSLFGTVVGIVKPNNHYIVLFDKGVTFENNRAMVFSELYLKPANLAVMAAIDELLEAGHTVKSIVNTLKYLKDRKLVVV